MGKLITFWSPYVGQAKVTSTMCAIAATFGIQYPEIRVALSHTTPDSMDLEEKLDYRIGQEEKRELYGNFGVSALVLNYMQAALTSEKIRRCGMQLFMKSLWLYPYAGKEKEMNELKFHLLSERLKREYEVVFLDLENGNKELSHRFLGVADMVVVVLPQSPMYWQRFFSEDSKVLEGKNYVIVLGGYLEKTRYSARYYIRKKELKTTGILMGVIPLNANFFDAMSDGKTLHFFLKNQLVTKQEDNYEFMYQAKKTAENIKKRLFFS